MLRPCHEPSFYGVLVQVIQLLFHHFIAGVSLRMKSLLPDLMRAFGFMRRTEKAELVQEPLAIFLLQLIEKALRCVALEVGHDAGEVGRGQDGVEMIVEDDPGVDFQTLVFAAVFEGFDDDIAAGFRCENRQPGDNRQGDEMGSVRLVSAIAASHGGVLRSKASPTSAFPSVTWERGGI